MSQGFFKKISHPPWGLNVQFFAPILTHRHGAGVDGGHPGVGISRHDICTAAACVHTNFDIFNFLVPKSLGSPPHIFCCHICIGKYM